MGNDALEIDQDLEHEQRAWKVRHISWVVMALIIVLALSGLLGENGPLVSAIAGDQGGPLWLVYDRFVHRGAQTTLELYLTPAADSNPIRVWINQDYVRRVQINQTVPAFSAQVLSDSIVYSFDASSSSGPIAIRFYVQPQSAGRLSGQMGITNGPSLSFTQLAYP